ncbi:MAG: hypothetical protein M3410_00160 [Acidobacteriota bacterium]|nr:hypothetical protein [Acidobacteriota bacterium]
MPDILVKIYLYFLIGSSLILFLLYGIFSLFERYRSRQFLVKPKYLWRNLFSLISGVAGAYFFASGLLGNSLVLLVTLVMIVLGTFAAELIERAWSKSGQNEGAT